MKNLMKRFVDFEVRKVEGKERTYLFTASTQKRARDGHVIVQEGWRLNNYENNPVVLWAHQSDQLPIGRGTPVLKGKNLQIEVEFVPSETYPFAGTVEKMVEQGFLRTGSVGFRPYKTEPLTDDEKRQSPENGDWGLRLYCELFEFSIVPVPADPGAVVKGGRAEDMRELIARSLGAVSDNDSKKSDLLPYEKDGKVDEKMLRASWALLNGCRGGVNIPESDHDAIALHLQRVAAGAGIPLPVVTTDENQNREIFKEEWDEEILDIQAESQSRELEEEGKEKRTESEQKDEELEKALEPVVDSLSETIAVLTEKVANLK